MKKPVDVIVLIDNSGSMTEEIVGVQKNINTNFATILDGSGLDYRVILISRHGKASSGQSVCIEAPLSGIPAGGCTTPPAKPVNNPSKFYHYSTEIGSLDSLCKIISTFTAPDEFMLAPNGWSEWARPEAFKVFVEITDDHASCGAYLDKNTVVGGGEAATKFDTDLLALSPAQFAAGASRNYAFYSIVAMAYNNPPTDPYEPTDPVLTTKCPTASNSGTGYQALSVLTNSLRFPLCDTTSYDVVFKAIAQGVIEGAKVSCDFPIPEAPAARRSISRASSSSTPPAAWATRPTSPRSPTRPRASRAPSTSRRTPSTCARIPALSSRETRRRLSTFSSPARAESTETWLTGCFQGHHLLK